MKIYVVFGSTGEYSDRVEWPVFGFKTLNEAQEYVLKLESLYKSFKQTQRGFQRPDAEMLDLIDCMRKFDPVFQEDYTGTNWFIHTVEVK